MITVEFLVWVVIAVGLAIAEIFTAGFFIIFFAIGAALTAVASYFFPSPVAQLAIFLVSSVVLIFFARPRVRKAFNITDEPAKKSNVDTLINEDVLVLEPVNRYGGKVRVLHTGEVWSAYIDQTNGTESLAEGQEGVVTAVDGAKLVIRAKGG